VNYQRLLAGGDMAEIFAECKVGCGLDGVVFGAAKDF
jgi:hypothetical protein